MLGVVSHEHGLLTMSALRQPKQLNSYILDATQTIYADIVFECDIKSTTTQNCFIANSNSTPRLIKTMRAEPHCAFGVVK